MKRPPSDSPSRLTPTPCRAPLRDSGNEYAADVHAMVSRVLGTRLHDLQAHIEQVVREESEQTRRALSVIHHGYSAPSWGSILAAADAVVRWMTWAVLKWVAERVSGGRFGS